MMACSLSLKPFVSSSHANFSSTPGNFPTGFGPNKRILTGHKLKLNFSMDREMDANTSAVDVVSECLGGKKIEEPNISTLLMNLCNKFDPYCVLNTPLSETATVKQPSAMENGPYDYTRNGNPTRDVLESRLANLEKADQVFCFTSRMAGLAAVAQLVGTGEEIVAGDDPYGGVNCLLTQVTPKTGVVLKHVNTCNLDEVASTIGPRTKLVWPERPTNPGQQICDIHKIAELSHAHGAPLPSG